VLVGHLGQRKKSAAEAACEDHTLHRALTCWDRLVS
jgi:hypothetical protein